MRLRRGRRQRVLAKLPAAREAAARAGALGADEIDAYASLAGELAGARVVLVTGSERSRVAIGLATVAATDGRRAVLVEADLASPSLAEALGLEPLPGLHEHLRGEVRAQETLRPLVLAGPASAQATEPLICVVAGAPGSAELLDTERCRAAVAGLRDDYERIVVLGTPLDGDRLALIALAEMADATLACGPRRELRGTLPIPVTGIVSVE